MFSVFRLPNAKKLLKEFLSSEFMARVVALGIFGECDFKHHMDLCTCAAQIKEAILNGVSLEDDKRDQFNKIQQVCFRVY